MPKAIPIAESKPEPAIPAANIPAAPATPTAQPKAPAAEAKPLAKASAPEAKTESSKLSLFSRYRSLAKGKPETENAKPLEQEKPAAPTTAEVKPALPAKPAATPAAQPSLAISVNPSDRPVTSHDEDELEIPAFPKAASQLIVSFRSVGAVR